MGGKAPKCRQPVRMKSAMNSFSSRKKLVAVRKKRKTMIVIKFIASIVELEAYIKVGKLRVFGRTKFQKKLMRKLVATTVIVVMPADQGMGKKILLQMIITMNNVIGHKLRNG